MNCKVEYNNTENYTNDNTSTQTGHDIDHVVSGGGRALCRIKLLPVTHVLVDTWMLTVKPVYKLLNVSDDLKWTTNTHVTPFSLTFKA